MDELKVLRAFRGDVAAADERVRARVMASLHAAIEAEKEGTTRRRPRGGRSLLRQRRGLALLLAGAAAATVVIGLVVAWPFGGSLSVLAQAAAAVGNRPVMHVVIEDRLGDSLVDLHSGRRTPAYGRSELWYDPQRGLLEIMTFRGQPVQTVLLKPGAKHDQDWLQTFFSGYRAALRAGAYRLTGSGVIDGTPVYWISSKPSWQVSWPFDANAVHKEIDQVAISKTTYKPVYTRTLSDGQVQPGSGVRILEAETIAPQPSLFARAHPSAPNSAGYNGWSTQTTLAQAQAAMGRPPLVPTTTIAGLHRSWIGQPSYLSGFQSYKDQLVGVELYYGHRDPNTYGVSYQAPFISITEFPHRNAYVNQQGLGYYPDNNHAVLENNTATLQTHGLYIIITASDPAHALAGAKALTNR